MSTFEPQDNDVIDVRDNTPNFLPAKTVKVSEVNQKVRDYLTGSLEGFDCFYLSASGGGWRRGKLRLRLEFIPDEPSPEDQQ